MSNYNKTYSEMKKFKTFEERLKYLTLRQEDVIEFGHNRALNQRFYKSDQWLQTRDEIISRDNGCDLGIDDEEIHDEVLIHHINPITPDDIIYNRDCLYDPENLITSSKRSHNPIHLRGEYKKVDVVERRKNDTCPWKS